LEPNRFVTRCNTDLSIAVSIPKTSYISSAALTISQSDRHRLPVWQTDRQTDRQTALP